METRHILVHTHIFKNAGSSFDDALEKNFGDTFVDHRDDHLIHKDKEFLNSYIAEHQNIRAFSSHSIYDKPTNFENVVYNTAYFIRHPIDRIKSVYSFEYKQPAEDSLGATMAKKFDFKGYVEWRMQPDVPPTIRNMQTIFTAGVGKGHGRMEMRFEAALKTLEENPLVALVDRYDESMVVFEEYLCEFFPDIDLSYIRRNVTDKALSLTPEEKAQKLLNELGEELAEKVLENNKYDIELYKRANELLDEKINHIENFQEKLENFQQRCTQLKDDGEVKIKPLYKTLKNSFHKKQGFETLHENFIDLNKYNEIKPMQLSKVSSDYMESLNTLIQKNKNLKDEENWNSLSSIKEKTLFLNTLIISKENLDIEAMIEEFLKFTNKKYLVFLLVNLKLFKHSINGPVFLKNTQMSNKTLQQINKNLNNRIPILLKYIEREKIMDNFIESTFIYSDKKEPLTIGVLLDEISPIKQNTLTRKFSDLIVNMLEHFSLIQFVILNSRIHTVDNKIVMPFVHVTRKVTLKDIFSEEILKKFYNRIQLLDLNELFYNENRQQEKIEINTLLTYRFKHKLFEKVFYQKFPIVDIEILSGQSNAMDSDILIPNGPPSQTILKNNFSKIVLAMSARFKYSSESSKDEEHLFNNNKYCSIVTVVKNLSIRPDFQAHKNSFFMDIIDFLNKNKKFSWTFVGFPSNDLLEIKESKILFEEGRLNVIEYIYDLPSFLNKFSFYIHPPTNGGGRSPAIAIENNTVALTFNFGDCTKYIPSLCQYETLEDILKEVSMLSNDTSKYVYLLEAEKKTVCGDTNYESALCFMSAIERAEAKFLVRNK